MNKNAVIPIAAVLLTALFCDCTKEGNPVAPKQGETSPVKTVLILNRSMKTNHYVPDFFFHFDYFDTVWTGAKGDSFAFLDSTPGMSLHFNKTDSFSVVRWTYDSGTVNGGTDYDDIAGGVLHASVMAARGDARDTIIWTVKINTLPWIETSQYAMTTRIFLGNSYLDTVKVSDADGDRPRFTVTDTAGLGLRVTGTEQAGDTTWCFLAIPAVTRTGAFGVSINVIDSLYGYDTVLALTYTAAAKTLITSSPGFMKYGAPVGEEYRDTIGIFDEYRSGFSGTLLYGPAGMRLVDSVIIWTPASAVEESVAVRMAHPFYGRGADTLRWAVKAVSPSRYVFWYHALANQYNLQENPGPNLPSDLTVFEGATASWCSRLCCGENLVGFMVGNGPDIPGRSSMVYFSDLCDKQGTAIKAVLRGEFRDAYMNNSFNNEGEIHAKIGVIDMTVSRDLAAPIGYGGAIGCNSLYLGLMPPINNGWNYNMKFYVNPGTKITLPGLMVEELVTLQGVNGRLAEDEPSSLDKQFFEIDVTDQVQWILNQKGRDYVVPSKAGDYAIAILVPNDSTAGGYGKVNLYAEACISGTLGTYSDAPWTQDGNTIHLYLEGDISDAP